MLPAELFRFCPRCGAPRNESHRGQNPLRCSACALTYYFNPTVAAAAWVVAPDGRVLLIRRAYEPAAGKFAIPGGFIDIGESAENGLRREIREEVGLDIDHLTFVLSHPNQYFYRDVTYPVVDLIFLAYTRQADCAKPLDGVAGIVWKFPAEIDPAELAFPSMQVSYAEIQRLLQSPSSSCPRSHETR
ncbi:MAG: NUDIX domain-containing protein [Gemmataceae bacterium]|nr:NUDIX domain-containing protein [Gemmata sp.]MDW8196903.1 NUDIX domain-containing protein [Gemmataceae bacterium]